MTVQEFLESYGGGQRAFSNLDFEYQERFSNTCFVDIVFENCFLYLDFRNSDLTNAQFIGCNLKEIDLWGAYLTNAKMTKCLVESALFKGAIVENFSFDENYYYSLTIRHGDFEHRFVNSDIDFKY